MVFCVASITKLVTAIAALQLVERRCSLWMSRYLTDLGEAKVLSETADNVAELAISERIAGKVAPRNHAHCFRV